MEQHILIERLNNTDLNMYQCGEEECAPGHSYGPAVRDHFLIHYVLKGKGNFQVGDKIYHLSKGQGFLICPDIVTYYEADKEDPWHYVWVGFHGLKAEQYLKYADLTSETPVFQYDKDNYIRNCFAQMMQTKEMKKSREIRLLGLLHLFLSQLIETAQPHSLLDKGMDRKEIYVKKAIEYVAMNYSREISVMQMAQDIGLNRSYLCSVFKQCLNMSPQQYLIRYRMDKACELMKNSALSIGDIARSVGYEDPLLFSKMFKRIKKLPPREFRKKFNFEVGC